MGIKTGFLIICMVVVSCHASKLRSQTPDQDIISKGKKVSQTISMQKKIGNAFYNFVNLAPTPPPPSDADSLGTTPRSMMGMQKNDEVIFADDAEEDAEITSTLSPPTTPRQEDVPGSEGGGDGEAETDPSDSPSDSDNTENSPNAPPASPGASSPGEGSGAPGEPVPGQPGEDALDSSSSSSSESKSSSSSSSSSEEYREAFKKAWEHKIKSEFNRPNKSKDVLARAYSPHSSTNKISKIKFSKRIL